MKTHSASLCILFVLLCVGCDQKPRTSLVRMLKRDKTKGSQLNDKSVEQAKQNISVRWNSPLKEVPLSVVVPKGFRVRSFKNPKKDSYSTITMAQFRVKGYPANISVTHYASKNSWNLKQLLLEDFKKRDALMKVSHITQKNIILRDTEVVIHSFSHSVLFPPFGKNATFKTVTESWIYLSHNELFYEFRLKVQNEIYLQYEKIFYDVIQSIDWK